MVARVTERVCIDLRPLLGSHRNNIRASRLSEMGMIRVLYKLIEVLQSLRHVPRRRYLSPLPMLTTQPYAT